MPLRADELKQLTRWMWVVRPDLAKLQWQDHVDELETLVALAAWRSQPLQDRVRALCEALDLERPAELERRGWTTDESTAGVDEWGHCGGI